MASLLRVMTFNLRRDVPQDGVNAWPHRHPAVGEVVLRHRPHVLGTQEGLPHQLAQLDAHLAGYRRVGRTRCGRGEDEAMALYYDAERLTLEASGDSWLSDRPEEPGSRAWLSACPRMVTWARFRDRETGRVVTCANTHLDHVSGWARRRSARLLAERFPDALVMGDFNATPGGAVHRAMTRLWQDTFEVAAGVREKGHTFHGFTGEARSRIDWILVPREASVESHAVVRDRPGGRLPSDHWPVLAELRL